MTAIDPTSLSITHLEVFLYRAPSEPPVQTSFGVMRSRPALLLRVTDADGAYGWGEVWCNFPSGGAEHRANLVVEYLRPLVCTRPWRDPRDCFDELSAKLAVLAIQTGEPGPFAQVVAGLDIAMWDLAARRAGQPLWRLLAGGGRGASAATPPAIPVYASGINPTDPELLAAAKLAEGYRAFKLKVGFGAERDDRNLRALREVIGADMPLMCDANQAWDVDQALAAGKRMATFDLRWLEEPMRADRPLQEWAILSALQPLPLAGGENLLGLQQFDDHLRGSGLAIFQPDLGKWGGFSGCFQVGRRVLAAGRVCCPHWLGGGIGLTASLHLKAAVGGEGFVEVDANPNLLRDGLAMPAFTLAHGAVVLSDRPGLGVEPDLQACKPYRDLAYQ